jgi:hypothetical protein
MEAASRAPLGSGKRKGGLCQGIQVGATVIPSPLPAACIFVLVEDLGSICPPGLDTVACTAKT